MSLADSFGQSARGLVRPGERPARRATEPATTTASPAAPVDAEAETERPGGEQPGVTTVEEPATESADEPAGGVAQHSDVQDVADPSSETGPGSTATSQSIVYVAPAVREALDALRKRDRRTNAELVFDALDRTQHQLVELMGRQNRHQRPASSLFGSRPGRTRPRSISPEERTVPFTFRATAAELTVIDRLVETSGAASRSALVAVALEAVYTRGQRRRR